GAYEEAEAVYHRLRVRFARESQTLEIETTVTAKAIRSQGRKKARQAATPSPSAPTGNTPFPLTKLLGRDDDLWQILARLETSRLVTLTGMGGIGKTQLSLAVAHEAWPDFPHGVWFIDLSTLRSRAESVSEILRVLALKGTRQLNEEELLTQL